MANTVIPNIFSFICLNNINSKRICLFDCNRLVCSVWSTRRVEDGIKKQASRFVYQLRKRRSTLFTHKGEQSPEVRTISVMTLCRNKPKSPSSEQKCKSTDREMRNDNKERKSHRKFPPFAIHRAPTQSFKRWMKQPRQKLALVCSHTSSATLCRPVIISH